MLPPVSSTSTEARVQKFLLLESVMGGGPEMRDRVSALREEHGGGVLSGVGSVVGVEHRVQDLECVANVGQGEVVCELATLEALVPEVVEDVGEMVDESNVVPWKEEMDWEGLGEEKVGTGKMDSFESYEDLKEEVLDMVSDYFFMKLYIQCHYFLGRRLVYQE